MTARPGWPMPGRQLRLCLPVTLTLFIYWEDRFTSVFDIGRWHIALLPLPCVLADASRLRRYCSAVLFCGMGRRLPSPLDARVRRVFVVLAFGIKAAFPFLMAIAGRLSG